MRRVERSSMFALVLSLVTIAACDDATEGSDGETAGVLGTLLYRIDPSPGHRIEFFEFPDGQNAVHESLPMDHGSPLLDSVPAGSSLAEIFRALKPGQEVPSVIVRSDARATAFFDLQARYGSDEAALPETSRPAATKHVSAIAADTCSADVLADGWGGNWFINTYCNEGGFRWCDHNRGGATTGNVETTWFKWTQMEGDFNVRGWTRGRHRSCNILSVCTWVVDWDYDVLPRHVERWTYTGTGRRVAEGSSPCGHLHFANEYNR